MTSPQSKLVTVYVAQGMLQAQVVQGWLQANNIPAVTCLGIRWSNVRLDGWRTWAGVCESSPLIRV